LLANGALKTATLVNDAASATRRLGKFLLQMILAKEFELQFYVSTRYSTRFIFLDAKARWPIAGAHSFAA